MVPMEDLPIISLAMFTSESLILNSYIPFFRRRGQQQNPRSDVKYKIYGQNKLDSPRGRVGDPFDRLALRPPPVALAPEGG